MRWLVSNMKWVLLISGALTCSMLLAVFSPTLALQQTFGDELTGPLAEIIVRSWGVMIVLIGGMLIHAALNPSARPVALTVAAIGKSAFIALVLIFGSQYLDKALLVLVFDSAMVVLFVAYLIDGRSALPAPSQ